VLDARIETLTNGHRVRVARTGSGPPVVFLHGYPDNLQIWSELAVSLSSKFQAIAFDWPGMGYSEVWKGGTTPWHMADRLLVLLDEWGIDKATVVGADMGGQPALVFAAKYPERVRQLVVMNCLAFPEEQTSWEIGLLRKFKFNRTILRRFPRIVFMRAERTFLPKGSHLPAGLREDMWAGFRQQEVREFIIRMCAGYEATLRKLPDLYPRITSPTLILWGQQDKHFPPAHAERLHTAIPGSRLEIIPGAEHWMAWYLATEIADRIVSQAKAT
jgi:pimeloyl-ACP methyl ester carboxylesterase